MTTSMLDRETRHVASFFRHSTKHGALALVWLAVALMLDPAAMAQSASGKGAGRAGQAGAGSGSAALSRRVEQLEEQLLDMQVMIGTLQSLARPGRPAGASDTSFASVAGGTGPANAAQMQGLETQVRALTAQVERLSAELRARPGRRSEAAGAVATASVATGAFTSAPVSKIESFPAGAAPAPDLSAPGFTESGGSIAGFGSTTVTPGADSIGRFLNGAQTSAPKAPARRIARAGGNPKQLYETAYGYLLQENYGAAQTAFAEFVELHPNDPLAGNAQYWLGETYFVRGKFKAAANAFLAGYQTYGRSTKAPDSLLKLAMSLGKLGQKQVACSSFAELKAKFPRAPAHVRNRAQVERRRAGC